MSNPLSNYFRTPELYIKLPSQGKWWPENSLTFPPNGEIPVCSMNGADDLAMKNADGLMNGDTTVKVIQSCCPSIKNAWDMPSIDLDSVFIAIRIASYGQGMDLTSKCTGCNHELEYTVDLRLILENIAIPDFNSPIFVNDLAVYLKPATYKINNLNSQDVYQQQRTILALKDASLTEEQKQKIIRDALTKMTEITVNRMFEYIDKIVTADGTSVTDPNFIKEFIANADRKTFDTINTAIVQKINDYKIPKVPVKCENCGKEDTRDLIFEPASFFASGS